MASFAYKRLSILDNLEIFTSEDESSYFPVHFHDVFCLSLITKGVEQLVTAAGTVFAPLGTISITNAGEAHQNKSALPGGYSYQTIYISPDLLSSLNNGSPIRNFRQVIEDSELYTRLSHLITTQCTNAHLWKEALFSLIKFKSDDLHGPAKADRFEFIDQVASTCEDERINLKNLSKLFHLSPYHFIREFKKAKGISPQTYIMLRRLQNVKRDLSEGASLKEVAWSNGFYDISHLNHSFKRFFGTTVTAYKNSNILQ